VCDWDNVIVGLKVLAAVVKAGASREHEMLAEIQGAVFAFIRKMENRTSMDTMLVSRVRILYIRSLLSRAPELQSLKVSDQEVINFLYICELTKSFRLHVEGEFSSNN
jgi:hypothetical protein